MIQLAEHFERNDRDRHPEWLRQRRWFIKARQDHQRREVIAERQEGDFVTFAADTIMATQIQIEKFRVKLDAYDEATVIALMENQAQIDAVQEQLRDLLASAYLMGDGRRAFKSEDGTFVIDEFGANVSHDELDFDLIPEGNPTAEMFLNTRKLEHDLIAERTQILKFQEKLDAAREEIADGEISQSDLDDLDAELADAMPSSVRAHVQGFNGAVNAPVLKADFTSPASPAPPTKTGAAMIATPALE